MKFITGKTYNGSFTCNQESTFEFEIIKRTAKRITIKDRFTKELKVIGVSLDRDNNEMAYPMGRYSMCPTIRANRFL